MRTSCPPPVCPRRHVRLPALLVPLAAYVGLLATGSGEGTPQDSCTSRVMGGACVLAATRAFVGQDRAVWALLAGAMSSGRPETRGGSSPISRASRPRTRSTSRSTPRDPCARPAPAPPCDGTLATLWADGWVASLGVASAAAVLLRRARARGQPRRQPARAARQPRLPDRDTLLLALVVGAIVATRGRMRDPGPRCAPRSWRWRSATGSTSTSRGRGPTRTAPCSRRAGSSRRCACRGRCGSPTPSRPSGA